MTQTKRPFPIWPLILLGFLLIFGWFGVRLWRTVQASQALLARQTQIETLLATDLTTLDPNAIETLLLDTRRDILTIKRETQPFLPLLPYLTWLPQVGPMLPETPHLLEMADAGTEAAAFALRGLKPGLAILQDDSIPSTARLTQLVAVIDDAKPDLRQTELSFNRFLAARAQIEDETTLPWRVQTLLTQVDELAPLAQDGLQLSLILPELLGKDGPKHYLIIAQNEDEIRPTGGFITGAGVIVIENGRIVNLTFQDANNVDNWREKPYDFPPQPLFDFMQLELFLFRDANFWPDFPTSAETAMELYSYGQEYPTLDGAIAVDQQFLKLLLEAVGPVTITDENVLLTAQNLINNLRLAWSNQEGVNTGEWVRNRKAFFEVFATAIQQRLESNFSEIDPIKLTQNMIMAVETKHLQIYMRDPAIANTLQTLRWDGRFPHTNPPIGDTLLVLDTNLGYSKSNLYIDTQFTYEVTLTTNDNSQAQLTVQHTHTGPNTETFCEPGADYYANSPDYLEGADKCYWNYLRVYAPAGTTLINATTHTIAADELFSGIDWQSSAQPVNETPHLTTFANFFLLRRAQQIETIFTYQLPPTLIQDNQYHLTIYKQAGTRPQMVQFNLTLPPNTQLTSATPQPTTVTGQTLHYKLTLDKDTDITVRYK